MKRPEDSSVALPAKETIPRLAAFLDSFRDLVRRRLRFILGCVDTNHFCRHVTLNAPHVDRHKHGQESSATVGEQLRKWAAK